MEIPALPHRSVDPASMPLERLATSTQVSEADKIAGASHAFEALLLRQILQEAQRPMFPSKFVGNSTTDSIYRDLVTTQLAENIAKSGTFGLAKDLTGDLQQQAHSVAKSGGQPQPPKPALKNRP